jgi:hypothetical protein
LRREASPTDLRQGISAISKSRLQVTLRGRGGVAMPVPTASLAGQTGNSSPVEEINPAASATSGPTPCLRQEGYFDAALTDVLDIHRAMSYCFWVRKRFPDSPQSKKLRSQMAQLQRLGILGIVAAAAIFSFGIKAQVGDPGTLIQEKLVSQIKLTKPTADHTDIVTAGDVLVLHKDGLMMCSSDSSYAFSNTYSGGVLAANYNNRAKDAAKSFLRGRLPFGGGGSATDAANNGCASRKFVAGEKFWVTGITLQKDGILVNTFSDPYNDVRFYGEIKFAFPRGSAPPVDDFVKTVSEVLTVQPADDSGQGNQGDQGAQPAPAAAPASMQAIAPPPPPADAPPPTIAIGQTKDQVTAGFGQPVRIAKLGAKEIYYYKDMKVTFTNGKVSNVE